MLKNDGLLCRLKKSINFVSTNRDERVSSAQAVIAQLVEHQLPKLRVASSSLVYRSKARTFVCLGFFC